MYLPPVTLEFVRTAAIWTNNVQYVRTHNKRKNTIYQRSYFYLLRLCQYVFLKTDMHKFT